MSYKIITDVSKIDKIKWYEFVKNHRDGNIFQTPSMYNTLINTDYYEPLVVSVFDSSNKLVGILLAQIQRQFSGILGAFTARSVIIGGPLVTNNNILELILNEYNKVAKKKVIYSQFRNFWSQQNQKAVFGTLGFGYNEHLNILVDLSMGEEALWKGIKKQRKEGIRKAKRNNLIFEETSSKEIISVFYNLLKISYSHAKLPYPKIDFFYSLYENLSNNYLRFFTIRKDKKTLAVLLVLLYNKCIYAYYVGIIRENEYLKLRPVDLLYWEVMRWGIENKFNTFDWMGAGKPKKEYGVRKFKLEYGGDLFEFGRYEKIHKSLMMKIGKIGFKIYQKLI